MNKKRTILTGSGPISENPRPSAPSEERFYVIWCPTGVTNPSMRFSTIGPARATALNMAKRIPGEKFYVVQAQEFYQMNAVARGILT